MLGVRCVVTGDTACCIPRGAEFVQRVGRHRTVNYATSWWMMILIFFH